MQTITLNTTALQNVTAKAVKGVGNNKLLPITGLIGISCIDGVFSICSFDGMNYLYVRVKTSNTDAFKVVVNADTFIKLVSKFTCKEVTLTEDNGVLTVVGNGVYKIALPTDENGDYIVYPDPAKHAFDSVPFTVSRTDIEVLLNTCKPALATTLELPIYTGYYVGESVLATDTFKICGYDKKLFNNACVLAPEFVDLASTITADTVRVYREDSLIVFDTDDVSIWGRVLDNVEDYAVADIMPLVKQEFDSMCKVNRNAMLAALDRIALFVGPYDNRAVSLNFTTDALSITSRSTSGAENLGYLEARNATNFICEIDIDMLVSQVKASRADIITIEYGQTNSIKFVDNEITQVIALLEGDI